MNYYEHHIKDYAAATLYHTWDQDMAYTRMLRWYYRKEKPLPADPDEVCRQIGATTDEQRAAVGVVLRDFFRLEADGWHNDTCDENLARFHAGEPAREAKKRNEDTRLDRHRRERAELFAELNAAGEHLSWNVPIAQLRDAVGRIRTGLGVAGGVAGSSKGKPPAPSGETGTRTPATKPATGTATPATATQYPITNHQSPNLIDSGGVPAALPPAAKRKTKAAKDPGPTVPVWEAYCEAYTTRYGVAPVRNAQVNGVLAQFVSRIPAGDAPELAGFYVTLNNPLYVRSHHAVQPMLRDAEGLYTQWRTGRTEPAAPLSARAASAQQALAPLTRRNTVPELEAADGSVPRIR